MLELHHSIFRWLLCWSLCFMFLYKGHKDQSSTYVSWTVNVTYLYKKPNYALLQEVYSLLELFQHNKGLALTSEGFILFSWNKGSWPECIWFFFSIFVLLLHYDHFKHLCCFKKIKIILVNASYVRHYQSFDTLLTFIWL